MGNPKMGFELRPALWRSPRPALADTDQQSPLAIESTVSSYRGMAISACHFPVPRSPARAFRIEAITRSEAVACEAIFGDCKSKSSLVISPTINRQFYVVEIRQVRIVGSLFDNW